MQNNWYKKELLQKLKKLQKLRDAGVGTEKDKIEASIQTIENLLTYSTFSVQSIQDKMYLDCAVIANPDTKLWDKIL